MYFVDIVEKNFSYHIRCKWMKWLYLESLSTTTSIQFVALNFGRPSMKSMDITSHAPLGTDRGASNLGYLDMLGLACWHVKQA
jgi:hypothetical protein